MLFKSVTGQDELKQQLTQAVREGRTAHAQLFWGHEGSGALPLALALTQYINCPNRTEHDACGECPTCNKIQKLIHPDLHFAVPVNSTKEITSDKKPVTDHFITQWRAALLENPYLTEQAWYQQLGIENKQGIISVNEAAKIIEKLHYKPFESGYKTMIIWLPERMNTAAANRLLKLVEEPPSKTLFLFVSEDPTRILKTIQSRTQPIRVPPIEESTLTQHAIAQYHLPEAHAKKVARAAAGSLSKLRQIITTEHENNAHFTFFSTLMRTAYAVDGLALMNWAEEAAQMGREQQKTFLVYALQMLRESFMHHRQAEAIAYLTGEEATFARRFSPFINERNILEVYKIFNATIAHLAQNGNAKIIFTDLALQTAVLIKK